jgi:hypothetical protein
VLKKDLNVTMEVVMPRFIPALAVGVLTLLPHASLAESPFTRCVEVSQVRDAILGANGSWTEVTSDQWQFLRGIYAMNPGTPAGLPYGDKAVLARINRDPGGVVFFIDGDRACTPMRAPPELLAMMQDVETATISHESGGL